MMLAYMHGLVQPVYDSTNGLMQPVYDSQWAGAAGVYIYICYRQVRFNSGLIQPVYSGMIVLVIFIDRRHDKTTVLEG
jgi:hypothetical protein